MREPEQIKIRKGNEQDIETLFKLVEELAVHHKHDPEYIANTAEQMKEDAFGLNNYFHFFVAEEEGQIVGAAIYYFTYSTWKGKSLYLEDLIVTDGCRGKGVGKMLMQNLAQEAVKHKAQKMKWQVAEDNFGAINFYEKISAELDPDWINCELNFKQLQKLGTKEELKKELVLN